MVGIIIFYSLNPQGSLERRGKVQVSGLDPIESPKQPQLGATSVNLIFLFFIRHKINILTCRLVGINCNDTMKALGRVSWE